MKKYRVICFILLYIFSSQFFDASAQGMLGEKWVKTPSDTSYQSIIERLETDYQISFSYSPNILQSESYFLTSNNTTIGQLFDQIFTDKNIAFEIVNERRVLLYKIKIQKIKISGVIRDLNSKESIPAASIIVKELGDYVYGNDDGYFYLEAENVDSLTLIFNSIGYSAKTFVKKQSASKQLIELEPDYNRLIAVITPTDDSINTTFPIDPFKLDPDSGSPRGFGPLGHPDIGTKIKDHPDVQNGNEAQSGFVVKGGSTDQNLILVDGIPIYDISHIGGLSSIFISSAVKDVELYTSGIPAEYGGKLSSVMDVKINEGNTKQWQGDFALGLTGAEGHIEGPLIKEKTAISLSGRFNDLNLLSDAFFTNFGGYEDTELNFYDAYAKLHHKFSPTNRISLTLYKGNDRLFLYSNNNITSEGGLIENIVENEIRWGNDLMSLQWNKLITDNVFLSAKLGYSKYGLEGNGRVSFLYPEERSTVVGVNANSEIKNLVASIKFDLYSASIGKINFGANTIMHSFAPSLEESIWTDGTLTNYNANISTPSEALEVNGFIENAIDFSDNLSFRGGLHLSTFSVIDTSFFVIEPRANVSYKQGKNQFDLNISINHQYVHFLTNPGTGLPSDIWVPSSKDLSPSESQEVSLSYLYKVSKHMDFRIHSYFKYMKGLKENVASSDVFLALLGDSLNITNILTSEGNWLKRIEEGRGYSAGIGAAFKYDKDKLHFSMTYAFSYTKHLFPGIQRFLGIDQTELFFARHHRPHDFLSQLSYDLTDNLTLSCKYVYGSGIRYTYPNREIQGPPKIFFATGRNNAKFPDFHHLDINANYTKYMSNYKLNFNIGLYNVYNRNNIFYTLINVDENNDLQEKVFGLLPILPSLTFVISY